MAAPLRYAKAFTTSQVLAYVQCGFAGALDIESGGVLGGEWVSKPAVSC